MAHIEPPRRTRKGEWWTRVSYRIGGRGTPLLHEPIVGYPTEKDCLQAATHWANDFERRKYLGQVSPAIAGETMTCGEVTDEYLEHHVREELADNSIAYYESAIETYFRPFFDDMLLAEVTPLIGQRWRKWLKEEAARRAFEIAEAGRKRNQDTCGDGERRANHNGKNPTNRNGKIPASRSGKRAASVNGKIPSDVDEGVEPGQATAAKMVPIARGIFTFAQKMGWRPDHPLENLKPPKAKRKPKAAARRRKWAPTALQIEAIRHVISQKWAGTRNDWVIARDRLFVSMMGYEACRQEDLYSARWWQLINEDGTVRRYFIVPDGKTRAAERTIKLWRQVREEIAAYYELMGRPDLDSLVFPGVRGAEMTRQNWQRDAWRPALEAVRALFDREEHPEFTKLPKFGPHRLRAGAATMLGYALTPIHVALHFLGHEQWTTTAKFYLVAFEGAEGLEGVPVEEQIDLARNELATKLDGTSAEDRDEARLEAS